MRGHAVRRARRGDREAIRELIAKAFERPDEAELVDALEAGGHVVLSLVAENVDGGVVGHALFTRVSGAGGADPLRAVALGPLSVSPAQQGEGFGTALVRHGHEELAEAGEEIVFVLGDPAYYGRFGYGAALAECFVSPWPGSYFQALALRPLNPKRLTGNLAYPAPFLALE